MISKSEDNRMLGYELFSAYPNISCFTTTRMGGGGKGAYASFNCSPFCGDDEEVVLSNQELLCRNLPCTPEELIIPLQVHGNEIAMVDAVFLKQPRSVQREQLNGVDAVITTVPGRCVCVSTADCVPVLVYDRRSRAVAAIHAGWRGAVNGIVTKTLAFMHDTLGTVGEETFVAIGPSISLDSFEVGEEVYRAFETKAFDMSRISCWKEETQKYHIDLWEANSEQIRMFGVPENQIACAGICTFIHHDEFFSARRLGIQSGRILSGIMLNGEY